MALNRLEKIGTIYTRVTGLIRAGAMKLEDRPLWYEIYQAFPPVSPPRYDNIPPKREIKQIFYPEDAIRAKFYKKLSSSITTNMVENGRPTACQIFLDTCQNLASTRRVNINDVFDEVIESTREQVKASRIRAANASKTIGSPPKAPAQTVNQVAQKKSPVEMDILFSKNDDGDVTKTT